MLKVFPKIKLNCFNWT